MNSVCTIFCTGVILKTIQLNNLYNDSKTFVDMPLKYSPDIVMENFLKLPNATTKEGPSKKVLKEFLADNFSPVGSDLIPYQFSDWQEEPPFLNQLKDNKTFFDFAKAINKIWLELGRKAIDDVKDNPSHHTLLYTPNPISFSSFGPFPNIAFIIFSLLSPPVAASPLRIFFDESPAKNIALGMILVLFLSFK